MGTLERREREKQATRQRIVDSARRLFAEQGYDLVSMRRIAEDIEYSPTAIYVHFKDKETLFHEICQVDFAALATTFRDLAGVADPIERIRQTGMAYVRFALRHPNHYRLMFMTPHRHAELSEEDRKSRGNPDEDAYAFLRTAVVEGIEAGRFSPQLSDADLVTQTLWAGVHGVASLAIVKADDPWVDCRPADALAHLMCDSIIAGLTAGARRRARSVATKRTSRSRRREAGDK